MIQLSPWNSLYISMNFNVQLKLNRVTFISSHVTYKNYIFCSFLSVSEQFSLNFTGSHEEPVAFSVWREENLKISNFFVFQRNYEVITRSQFIHSFIHSRSIYQISPKYFHILKYIIILEDQKWFNSDSSLSSKMFKIFYYTLFYKSDRKYN